MRRLITAAVSAAAVLVVLVVWIVRSNSMFEETFYFMDSYKVEEPFRVIVLSDLHQKSFGKNNERLISRIGALKPDAIVLAGDIVNKRRTDWAFALELCGALAEIAPVYYGMGNHENKALYGSDLDLTFLEEAGEPPEDFSELLEDTQAWSDLEETGVHLLQNSAMLVDIKGNPVKIGGVGTNLSSFWPYSGEFITRFTEEDPEAFKLLICHRPEVVTEYLADGGFDLALSGHNHGGIIRIPGVGGLISDAEGLFPVYDGGWYAVGDAALCISRGLGGHGPVPRVFNPPELAVVDIR